MKKSILFLSALLFSGMTALAQQPLYKMKITLQDGSKVAALTDEIDSMQLVEVGKAEADVELRYKTSSPIAVTVDAEASVTRIQAAIIEGSERDPSVDYTAYVQQHSVCDAQSSCTVAFDFLKPETIYTVYVLAYDENELPTGLKTLTVTTGAVADDPFTVTASHIGNTSVSYTVTPKDPSIKYYTLLTGEDYYKTWQNEEGAYGDVLQHFISMWAYFASWYGDTWQSIMQMDLLKDTQSSESSHLMWNARQVAITFGMDNDGNLITPIQIDSFHTTAPTPSEMQIPVTVVHNAWGDVQVQANPTTDEPYFLAMQPAEYVDLYDNDEALLRALCYEADNINPVTLARTRDTDEQNGLWEFRPRREVDTDYYIIAIGLDDGAPATIPFKTKITVPGGSY